MMPEPPGHLLGCRVPGHKWHRQQTTAPPWAHLQSYNKWLYCDAWCGVANPKAVDLYTTSKHKNLGKPSFY